MVFLYVDFMFCGRNASFLALSMVASETKQSSEGRERIFSDPQTPNAESTAQCTLLGPLS